MLVTDAQSLLDGKGAVLPKSDHVLKFIEFVGSLIVSSTFSNTKTPNPLCFSCASHVTSVVSHTGHIVWQCNSCDEEGIISNWHKTLWDMTDYGYKKLS